MCPDIADPANGQIVFATDNVALFDLATTATYSCYYGYGLMGGDTVRTCMENGGSVIGMWSGMAPSCGGEEDALYLRVCEYTTIFSLNAAITCSELSDIMNGDGISYDMSEVSVSSGTYPFDTVATYDGCVTGYALVGDSTSMCTGDGTTVNGAFDGTPPTCEGE